MPVPAPAPYALKAAFNEADLADKPYTVPLLTPADQFFLRAQYKARLESLRAVDDLIGEVVAALGERLEDTVLIFTSDNGFFLGDHRLSGKEAAYEEAIRVPLYVRLPLRLLQAYGAAGYAPRTVPGIALNNDLAPTIVELAGVAAPRADGRSLVPLLRAAAGTAPPAWRKQFLVEHWWRGTPRELPTYAAVRTGPDAAVPNALYVEYREQLLPALPPSENVIFREFYDLVADRDQLRSDPTLPQAQALSGLLQQLRRCRGATPSPSCAAAENG